MSKHNTLRNYRIASLYGRMSYSKIARIIGCSRSCVAGVIRWHVKKIKREGSWQRLEDLPGLPPTVAYVGGLEGMKNSRYRMSTERGQADAT